MQIYAASIIMRLEFTSLLHIPAIKLCLFLPDTFESLTMQVLLWEYLPLYTSKAEAWVTHLRAINKKWSAARGSAKSINW